MKNKKKKVKLGIMVIFICIISGLLGYFVTLKIDEARKGGNIKVKFTLADTETYSLSNTNILSYEDALKEWPYIFYIENEEKGHGEYQILIKDISGNLTRNDLEYTLFLDEKEVAKGKLKDIKNNSLFHDKIAGNKKIEGKLYIWNASCSEDDLSYEYKLDLEVIKSGGPGF